MKFTSILSAGALLNGAVSAACVTHSTKNAVAKRDSTTQYRLKLKTEFEELDDLYLSTSSSIVGIYQNGTKDGAIKITVPDIGKNSDETISLTPYPIGIVEHALGLVGTNGYLEFRDLTQPSGQNASSDNGTYSYNHFTLKQDRNKKLGRKLLYKDVEPGWIASPTGNSTWKIKNYDGDLIIIQNYVSVDIYLEEVDAGEENEGDD